MESKQLAEVASDTTRPREGLRAVASLRLLVESLEFQQVEAALRAGFGWGQVAESLGVSRQAVHKKYAATFKPLKQFTVAKYFGSLSEAQKVHFNDGGQFDKLYTPGAK